MGYYITIKNNLLEAKHVEKMGSSVWLYMWLIDKVMAINENGIGKVLNGRPVVFERVEADLGISRATYKRWMKQLSDAKYIRTIRTPYGLTVYVNKAAKMWGQKSAANNASLFDEERKLKNEPSDLKKPKKTTKRSIKNEPSHSSHLSHQWSENEPSNNNNSNRHIYKDNITAKGELLRNDDSEIGKLYYQVIKQYELPVTNHNVIKAKIKQWEKEDQPQKAINYLKFLLNQYQDLDLNYKPQISTALDIYAKRAKIKNALQSEIRKTNHRKIRKV